MQEHVQCCPRFWGVSAVGTESGDPGGAGEGRGEGARSCSCMFISGRLMRLQYSFLHSLIVHVLGTSRAGGTVLGTSTHNQQVIAQTSGFTQSMGKMVSAVKQGSGRELVPITEKGAINSLGGDRLKNSPERAEYMHCA